MADISDNLITYLRTISGVTGIVGTSTAARIYNQDGVPQGLLNTTGAGLDRGAICLVKQTDENIYSLAGDSALNVGSFAFTCFATTPTLRNALAQALYDALTASDAPATAIGTGYITDAVCTNRASDADYPASDGTDQRLYASQSAWRLWYCTS